jgi:hypothetical protein
VAQRDGIGKHEATQGNRVKKCVTNGWGAESVVAL